jgi:hypothetical protein
MKAEASPEQACRYCTALPLHTELHAKPERHVLCFSSFEFTARLRMYVLLLPFFSSLLCASLRVICVASGKFLIWECIVLEVFGFPKRKYTAFSSIRQ